MNVLSCVGWFLDGDMRCGWNDVVLWLELTICCDHKIHIYISFWWVVCKKSRFKGSLISRFKRRWIQNSREEIKKTSTFFSSTTKLDIPLLVLWLELNITSFVA